MGNKQLKIEYKKDEEQLKIENKNQLKTENKVLEIQENNRKNNVARAILENNVQGIPTDNEITLALSIQQSQQTGPLKKLDLIAILIRLNPHRNNALISQYNVQDIINLIRYELYTKPLSESLNK